MSFRFKRLEKYKISGTKDNMNLRIPLPESLSGKVYRWCPNVSCSPRLFLLGDINRPNNLDISKLKRNPDTNGTTCPYCGIDANDDEYHYEGDIKAIHEYIEWAASQDITDYLKNMTKDFNRSQQKGGLISIKMNLKTDHSPEPRVWREDLIRNLSCDICGREYGVYAIALFCPDCGSKNLHTHFEREIELILKQIDLAEYVSETEDKELSYRILGNAHEDVVTAFETYQKTFYKYKIKHSFSEDIAKEMTSKKAIGNRFQNIDRAIELYKNLSINPFIVLSSKELELMKLNIEKRHLIGHNLSMADEAYSDKNIQEKPGTTIQILADEISEFAETSKKIILELEKFM